MKARSLLVTISAFLTTRPGAEGYKVRACAGQEAHLTCSSGLYVDVITAVGGFGPSGTPCTSTASCTTSYVQGALTEVNGNIGAFAINTCKNNQTCDFMIQSSWHGGGTDCNNQDYNIIYVDVEYICSPLSSTASTSVTSSTGTNTSSSAISSKVNPSTNSTTTTATTTTTTSTTTTKPSNTQTNSVSTKTKTQPSGDGTTSNTQSDKGDDSIEGNWWWYVVAGVGGVLVIVIIVIIVICVTRKRRKKENDDDERRHSGTMYTNGRSDDVMPYTTATAASAGSKKPDILYDSTVNDADDDDVRVSTIDCYATTTDKGTAECGSNDVISDGDKSAEEALYAVVDKNRKRANDPNEKTMIENEKYVSA